MGLGGALCKRGVCLCMPVEKHRVTLYLEKALYDRFRAVVDSVPGMTLSGAVSELLADFVPVMEELLELSKSGDRDAQAEMMSLLLGRQFLALAQEGTAALRQVSLFEEEEKRPD